MMFLWKEKEKEIKKTWFRFCPNASLEAIAWCNPQRTADLKEIPELKSWFAEAFGDSVVAALGAARRDDKEEPQEEKRERPRKRR